MPEAQYNPMFDDFADVVKCYAEIVKLRPDLYEACVIAMSSLLRAMESRNHNMLQEGVGRFLNVVLTAAVEAMSVGDRVAYGNAVRTFRMLSVQTDKLLNIIE